MATDSEFVKRMKQTSGMSDTAVQAYSKSLRRLLYVNTILQTELEWTIGLAPAHPLSRLLAGMHRNLAAQVGNVSSFLGEDTKNFFRDDLTKDAIHDIANVVHHLADLDNVDAIERIIADIRKRAESKSEADQTITFFDSLDDLKGFVLLFITWLLEEPTAQLSAVSAGDLFLDWYTTVYPVENSLTS